MGEHRFSKGDLVRIRPGTTMCSGTHGYVIDCERTHPTRNDWYLIAGSGNGRKDGKARWVVETLLEPAHG